MKKENPGQDLLRLIDQRKQQAKKGLENYLFHVNTDKEKVIIPAVDLQTGEVRESEKIDFPIGTQLFFSQVVNRKHSVFWGVHRYYRFHRTLFKREILSADQINGLETKAAPRKEASGGDLKNIFGASQIEIWDTIEDSREFVGWTRDTVNITDFWAFWTSGQRPSLISRDRYREVFKILIERFWNDPASEEKGEKEPVKIIL